MVKKKQFVLWINQKQYGVLLERQSLTIPCRDGLEDHVGKGVVLRCVAKTSISAMPISSTVKPTFGRYVTIQPAWDGIRFNT